MRRYGSDFDRRPGRPNPPERYGDDLDPNYRAGRYRGERVQRQREWQAPYGQHRWRHADDLGGYGGYPGVYGAYRTRFLGGPAGHGQLGDYEDRPGGSRRDQRDDDHFRLHPRRISRGFNEGG